MASLSSAQEVGAVVQATVSQQIQQIQQILSHVEEATVVPEDVGITQGVTNIIPPAVLPPGVNPDDLDDVTLCNSDAECGQFQSCINSLCVESTTTTTTTTTTMTTTTSTRP